MRTWLLPVFFCILLSAQGQHAVIDSLQRRLDKTPAPDTLRADLLNEISWWYVQNDIGKGIAAADESIEIARKLNDTNRWAVALNRKAANLNAMGRDSIALRYYDQVLDLRKNSGDSINLAKVLFNIGLVYYTRSDYGRSTAHYRRALSIFEKAGDSLLMARMYNSIAINYMVQGAHKASLSYYLRAARIYERQGSTSQQSYAQILSNIGLVYHHLNNLDAAHTYQSRALKLFEHVDNKESIANAKTNLGNIYQDQGNYQKSLEQYDSAHTIMLATGNMMGVANALTNMGDTYLLQGQISQAITQLQETMPMYERIGNTHNLSQVHESLGRAHHQLYLKNRDRQSSTTAVAHFKKAAQLAHSSGSLEIEEATLTHLADHYALLKKYKNALETREKAEVIRDSLNSLSRREEIIRLEEQYAYAKREDTLRALQDDQRIKANAEIQRQKTIKNAIILGIAFLLMAIAIFVYLFRRKQRAEQKQKTSEQEAQLAEYKYRALCAQLNPHFMLNAMNSLSAYIIRNQKEGALEYLAQFGNLMRSILTNSHQKFVPLKDDLDVMRNYLKLEKERLNGQLSYSINIEGHIDPENTRIPPAILQPFIENSIWHGPGDAGKKVHININISKKGDHLFCSVDDDGVGRKEKNAEEKTRSRKSVGIPIAKGRVETLGKLKGLEGSVRFIDKPRGLRVEVLLPYEKIY